MTSAAVADTFEQSLTERFELGQPIILLGLRDCAHENHRFVTDNETRSNVLLAVFDHTNMK